MNHLGRFAFAEARVVQHVMGLDRTGGKIQNQVTIIQVANLEVVQEAEEILIQVAGLEVAQEAEEILIQVVQTLVQVAQLLLLIRLLPQVQVMVHLIVHHVV